MSLYDYRTSINLSIEDPPFYALIMSAIRKADDINLAKLTMVFPEVVEEFKQRYNAPGGMLENERK